MKIINGGIYGVDFRGHVSPEYGNSANNRLHYAILVKTHQSDLYLSFPITTSKERSKYKGNIKNPYSMGRGYILLEQVRPVSKERIKNAQKVNGVPSVLTEDELTILFNEYQAYLSNRLISVGMSVNDYHAKRKASLENLYLNIHDNITITLDELNSVLEKAVIDYSSDGSNKPYLNHQLPKRAGKHQRIIYIKDSFSQKKFKEITINIINQK